MKKKVPKDIGFVVPNMPYCLENFSGMNMIARLFGRVAMDFFVHMIHHHERGVLQSPQRILVDGTWVPGETLRRMNN